MVGFGKPCEGAHLDEEFVSGTSTRITRSKLMIWTRIGRYGSIAGVAMRADVARVAPADGYRIRKSPAGKDLY